MHQLHHRIFSLLVLLCLSVIPISGLAANISSGIIVKVLGGNLKFKELENQSKFLKLLPTEKAVHVQFIGDPRAETMQGHFVAVQDISGSMNDENKLEKSKRALTLLLEQIAMSAKERPVLFSLITFNQDAQVVIDAQPVIQENLQALTNTVNGLKAVGGTNIRSAFLKGVAQFEKAAKHGQSFTSGTLALLTDGLDGDNVDTVREIENLRLFEKLAQEKNSAHVIALGKDVNATMLRNLATKSRGVFSPIVDLPEITSEKNPRGSISAQDQMWGLIAANTASTVASDIKVRVTVQNGAQITRIIPKPYGMIGLGSGNVEFTLAALAREEKKGFLVIVNDSSNAESLVVEVENDSMRTHHKNHHPVQFNRTASLGTLDENAVSNALAAEFLETSIDAQNNLNELLVLLMNFMQETGTGELKQGIEETLQKILDLQKSADQQKTKLESDFSQFLNANLNAVQMQEYANRCPLGNQAVHDYLKLFLSEAKLKEYWTILQKKIATDVTSADVKMLTKSVIDAHVRQTPTNTAGTDMYASKAQKPVLGRKSIIKAQSRNLSDKAFNNFGTALSSENFAEKLLQRKARTENGQGNAPTFELPVRKSSRDEEKGETEFAKKMADRAARNQTATSNNPEKASPPEKKPDDKNKNELAEKLKSVTLKRGVSSQSPVDNSKNAKMNSGDNESSELAERLKKAREKSEKN